MEDTQSKCIQVQEYYLIHNKAILKNVYNI